MSASPVPQLARIARRAIERYLDATGWRWSRRVSSLLDLCVRLEERKR
jgi:hypothetical protein